MFSVRLLRYCCATCSVAFRSAKGADRGKPVFPQQRLPRLFVLTCVMVVFAVLLTSCSVSQNALSSPEDAKPDSRLVGVWRFKKSDRLPKSARVAGGKLPASVVRIDSVSSEKIEGSEGTLLGFPTTIGASTYLNLGYVVTDQKLKALKDKGWDPDNVEGYLLMRYTIRGKTLRLQAMDVASLKKAIRAGRLKGEIAKETNEPHINPMANAFTDAIRDPVRVVITDTSENLRRLIASSEITFSEDEDGVFALERVE